MICIVIGCVHACVYYKLFSEAHLFCTRVKCAAGIDVAVLYFLKHDWL